MTKQIRAIAAPGLLSLVIASCAVPTFTNDDGSTSSDQQAATIVNKSWACPFCVEQISAADGKLLYDRRRDGYMDPLKLTPGTYMVGIKLEAPKRVAFQGTVDLKAGHVYRVKSETCFVPDSFVAAIFGGPCRGRGYAGTVWIEDTGTGEVVVGERWS